MAGQTADVESMVALKDFFNKIGSEHVYVDSSAPVLPGTTLII